MLRVFGAGVDVAAEGTSTLDELDELVPPAHPPATSAAAITLAALAVTNLRHGKSIRGHAFSADRDGAPVIANACTSAFAGASQRLIAFADRISTVSNVTRLPWGLTGVTVGVRRDTSKT